MEPNQQMPLNQVPMQLQIQQHSMHRRTGSGGGNHYPNNGTSSFIGAPTSIDQSQVPLQPTHIVQSGPGNYGTKFFISCVYSQVSITCLTYFFRSSP